MSISTILRAETKNEDWSKLYCNELHVKNLFADSVEGALIPQTNVVDETKYTMIIGNGVPNNTTSIFSKYKNEGKEFVIAACSLIVDNASANQISPGICQFSINLTLPAEFKIFYPLPGRYMGSGSSVQCVDGVLSYPTTVNLINNGFAGFDLRINITVHGNVSPLSATRQLYISFMLNYESL